MGTPPFPLIYGPAQGTGRKLALSQQPQAVQPGRNKTFHIPPQFTVLSALCKVLVNSLDVKSHLLYTKIHTGFTNNRVERD